MKVFGPSPPWLEERGYGWWHHHPADPDDWAGASEYWEWQPPRTVMERMTVILKGYSARMAKVMSEPMLLTVDPGKPIPRSSRPS